MSLRSWAWLVCASGLLAACGGGDAALTTSSSSGLAATSTVARAVSVPSSSTSPEITASTEATPSSEAPSTVANGPDLPVGQLVRFDLPDHPIDTDAFDLHCGSTSFCIASDLDSPEDLTFFFDGAAWTQVPAPASDVTGCTSRFCYATSTVQFWNGQQWTPPLDVTNDSQDISYFACAEQSESCVLTVTDRVSSAVDNFTVDPTTAAITGFDGGGQEFFFFDPVAQAWTPTITGRDPALLIPPRECLTEFFCWIAYRGEALVPGLTSYMSIGVTFGGDPVDFVLIDCVADKKCLYETDSRQFAVLNGITLEGGELVVDSTPIAQPTDRDAGTILQIDCSGVGLCAANTSTGAYLIQLT